jgi:glycosyl transferase, family 25
VNHLLSKFVDMAFCINLDRRPDRWARVVPRFARQGIDVHRFSAIDGNKIPSYFLRALKPSPLTYGGLGSLHSHLAIISLAKAMKLKGVLIFEDDVKFLSSFDSCCKTLCREMPENWDFFYFGGKILVGRYPVTPSIYRATYVYYNYAYMVNAKVYDLAINALSTQLNWADQILAGLHPQTNCYVMYPRSCAQIGRNDSDNLGRSLSFPLGVEDAMAMAGGLGNVELKWLWSLGKENRYVLEIEGEAQSTRALVDVNEGKIYHLNNWRDRVEILGFFKEKMKNWLIHGRVVAVDCKGPIREKYIKEFIEQERINFFDCAVVWQSGAVENCKKKVKKGGVIAGPQSSLEEARRLFPQTQRVGLLWWAINE